MNRQLDEIDISTVTGGGNDSSFIENIHPGDKFQNCIYVYEVIKLLSKDNNHNYDLFECKFWDSYASFMNGGECKKITNKYRCQLNSLSRCS